MRVLFIGGLFDDSMENEILSNSKGIVHYAANKFQWNLINGLIQIDSLDLEILSAPFIGAFPKDYKNLKIKGHKSRYRNIVDSNYIDFNNFWGYRSISRRKNLIKGVRIFAEKKQKNKVIMVYSPHTPFLQAAIYAKKIDPDIHICLIVPDLPQYMNLNDKRTFIYDNLKKIDIGFFEKNAKMVDSFVLLTEPMKKMLNVGRRPYVVVEGVVNEDNFKGQHISESDEESMTVVYTGTLNKKFGIVNLIDAFHNTNIKNTYLKICGRGDSEDIIKKYATKDNRIIFLGQLSNIEAVKIQKKATVLVNPRQNNEEYTKYSFPSKNMEYLLTGRPVIAYKLDGIPEEYNSYFHYVEDDSIESLSRKMEDILLMTEEDRATFGHRAKEFVLKEKNNISVSKKIIEMIREAEAYE